MYTKYSLKGYAFLSLGRLENETAEKILLTHFQKTKDKNHLNTIIHCFYKYKIQSQEVLDSIVDIALNSNSKQIKNLYIKLAQKYNLKDAEQNLLLKLEKEKDESVKMSILRVLANYRTKESMNAIINGFQQVTNYYNQIDVLKLLGKIDVELSYNILREGIKPNKMERTRLMALEGFRILRTKKIIDILYQLVNEDQDCRVRTKALRVIYSIIGRKFLEKCIPFLQDKSCPQLRIAAIRIIRKHKDVAKPLLLKVLREDEDQLVRKAALFALSRFTTEEVIKEIKYRAINDSGIEVRRGALIALENILGRDADKFIIEAMMLEKDYLVKRLSIRILGRLNTDNAIRTLLEELQSRKEKKLRNYILGALGKTKRKELAGSLLDIYMKDEDKFLQYLTAITILKINDQKTIEIIKEGYTEILSERLANLLEKDLKKYELFYKRGHSLGIQLL